MTTTFWIGIVFWCISTKCGMATTSNPYKSKEECKEVVDEMIVQIRKETSKKDVLEGRCSPINFQFIIT